jgi:tRNA (mo5U34)-methyltransferase
MTSPSFSDVAKIASDAQARLDELLWYHTLDVAPGVRTNGWWDLRHALPKIPFPDVKGKRCLDIGTWDGFYAFELERRGAAEVIAIDIADVADVDYPPEMRHRPPLDLSRPEVAPRSTGFHLVHELTQSKVQWRALNIYDLDPAVIGTFDVVICGSLLVHLRDPVRALDAARSVTGGEFVSIDFLHPPVHLMARKRPMFELRGDGVDFQWWLAGDAGMRQLLKVGGFDVEEASPYFLLRPGPYVGGKAKPAHWRERVRNVAVAAAAKDWTPGGHLHRAYRCKPRF